MQKILVRAKDVRYKRFDEEVVVLVPSDPSFHLFPANFPMIWESIDGKSSREEVCKRSGVRIDELDTVLQKMLAAEVVKEVSSLE